LEEEFKIKLATKRKINKVGSKISRQAVVFVFLVGLCFLPANYLPTELAIIYLIEFVHKYVYYIFFFFFSILVMGEYLRGLRSYETVELEIKPNKLIIKDSKKSFNIEYKSIKKIYGGNNLVHDFKSIYYINFIIKLEDNTKIEIRSHRELFNGLTDLLPSTI
jgi:hypothetical protein